MRNLLLALALTALALPVVASAEDLTLRCDYPVRPDDTVQTLLERFKGHAEVGEVSLIEETEPGVILYPDDPQRRIEIILDDPDKTHPGMITVYGEKSLWRGPAGLRMGSSLSDVVKANGKPVTIPGFDWDLGNSVFDDGGALRGLMGEGCAFYVELKLTVDVSNADAAEILGDRMVTSDNPAVKRAKPVVNVMRISW